jgi:hypothetical protein
MPHRLPRHRSPATVQIRNVWPGTAACAARVELMVVYATGRTQSVLAIIRNDDQDPDVRLIPACKRVALSRTLRLAAVAAWRQCTRLSG